MSRDANDTGDNPFQPTARGVRDPAHDAQLLRELATINAQIVAALGALPSGGLSAQPRRKPNLPHRAMPAPLGATPIQEDDPMKLHQIAAAALLPLVATGCSHTIDAGSATARLNPHPVKRYEVIATSEAPGPWDSIQAYIHYDVLNKKCVPKDWFTGAQNPPNVGIDVAMAHIGDNTWRGYFYQDALEDEDYFKLGVCRWSVTGVGISAVAQGVRFNWDLGFEYALHADHETRYFKRSVYGDRSFAPYGALDLDSTDPVIRQHPGDYFPVTIAVKEATP